MNYKLNKSQQFHAVLEKANAVSEGMSRNKWIDFDLYSELCKASAEYLNICLALGRTPQGM